MGFKARVQVWVGLGGGKELGWDSDERRIQYDSNSAGHSILSAIVLLSVPKPMPLTGSEATLSAPLRSPCASPSHLSETKQTLRSKLYIGGYMRFHAHAPAAARGPGGWGGAWGA